MKHTAGRLTAIGALAASASIVVLMAGADAHHPEVSASSSCADGLARVRIDASSWFDAGYSVEHRYNANVAVSFDGVTVGSGAFLPTNNYAFTVVTATKADGATHTVRATALAGFGPVGEFGSAGEFREAKVTLPVDCSGSVTATTTTTTSAGGTSTGGGGSTTNTERGTTGTTDQAGSVPVVVEGAVETRPDVAAPIVVQPRFAG